ncbi:hypothetical protein [Caballeronia ptereochthonis]|uniref:Uncharacterized protein n=1 Tax=Caballeronia ptereochthonis TaxID=1777144 RepID=A0A158DAF4_9BURK|nr:hypothetical protein [Caballeronia ptereochthonis]SAK91186.1 hypothetical protein AWB83_05184 [Caballeronia ptereochthonis]
MTTLSKMGAHGVRLTTRQTVQCMALIGYFFFVTLVDAELFGAGTLNGSATGDDSFLGCLGFFASRLLRI